MSAEAEARMERYSLLRWGFLDTHAAWEVVASGEWYARLEAALAPGAAEDLPLVAHLREAAAFPDAAAFLAAHGTWFGKQVRCPPGETDYTATHEFMQARDLADIAGFYRAFGYEPAGGERVDHIALELEFLYALAHREAFLLRARDQPGADPCLDATKRFLEDHLGRFAGRLHETLAEQEAHPFFVTLASLTRSAVEGDVARFGLAPAPAPARASRVPKDFDASPCGPCNAVGGTVPADRSPDEDC